jgi:hypothetical protein
MPRKYWKNGEQIGIVADDENKKLTLFAGGAAIELNGEDGKIGLSGSIAEMNNGDRTEEILLRKNAGLTSIIPSTTFSPIPQSFPNIPVGEIAGIIGDIGTMFSLLG